MPGTRLTVADLDQAAADAILNLVTTSEQLARDVDEPAAGAGDLISRLDERRSQGPIESIDQIADVAAGPDELENLLVAAYAAPLTQLQRRPDVANRQVGLDLVLLDPVSDEVHLLNPSATAVWYHLTPDRSFRAIIDAMAVAFGDAATDRVVLDLAEFLGLLRRHGLLLRGDEPVPAPSESGLQPIVIPDHQISTLVGGYMAPAVRTYSIAELEEELAQPEVVGFQPMAPFNDSWGGTHPKTWASVPSFEPNFSFSPTPDPIPEVTRPTRRLPWS